MALNAPCRPLVENRGPFAAGRAALDASQPSLKTTGRHNKTTSETGGARFFTNARARFAHLDLQRAPPYKWRRDIMIYGKDARVRHLEVHRNSCGSEQARPRSLPQLVTSEGTPSVGGARGGSFRFLAEPRPGATLQERGKNRSSAPAISEGGAGARARAKGQLEALSLRKQPEAGDGRGPPSAERHGSSKPTARTARQNIPGPQSRVSRREGLDTARKGDNRTGPGVRFVMASCRDSPEKRSWPLLTCHQKVFRRCG